MTTALVNWNRLADHPIECEFVGFRRQIAVVNHEGRERRVPRNCVQRLNGYYHDNRNKISESPGVANDFTVLTGTVQGRFGLATEAFTGDSFGEALEKAKKKGAVNVQRIL
ncbi:hypothetical protein KC723_03560 [Candidatus Kaiserbacteria bacterium]|nr:hypothetical protein [Candidatus Kaiserbacteria bacterium]